MAAAKSVSTDGKKEEKLWGAIANLGWPGAIIAYLVKKDNAFVRFHAVQSFLFGVVVSVLSIVTAGCGSILGLGYLLLIWKAWSGEKYMLPALGELADKYSQKSFI